MIERGAAVLSALAIVGTVLWLPIRNEAIADSRLFLALRVVMSVAAAGPEAGPATVINQSSSGAFSPPIANNTGTVIIQGGN